MTPENKIKKTIILQAIENGDYETYSQLDSDYVVEGEWEVCGLKYSDYYNEFRGGQEETDIPCGCSRNYELKSVASKMFDGSWVGWTYYYGGGKHGNPEEIEWIEGAYNLSYKEEEKLMTIKTFEKILDKKPKI